MPMTSIPQISPARIRSYILRLPFCTKVLVAAIVGLWVATIPFPWIRDFGALEPAKMDLTQSMFVLLLLGERGRPQCLCSGLASRRGRIMGRGTRGAGIEDGGERSRGHAALDFRLIQYEHNANTIHS